MVLQVEIGSQGVVVDVAEAPVRRAQRGLEAGTLLLHVQRALEVEAPQDLGLVGVRARERE